MSPTRARRCPALTAMGNRAVRGNADAPIGANAAPINCRRNASAVISADAVRTTPSPARATVAAAETAATDRAGSAGAAAGAGAPSRPTDPRRDRNTDRDRPLRSRSQTATRSSNSATNVAELRSARGLRNTLRNAANCDYAMPTTALSAMLRVNRTPDTSGGVRVARCRVVTLCCSSELHRIRHTRRTRQGVSGYREAFRRSTGCGKGLLARARASGARIDPGAAVRGATRPLRGYPRVPGRVVGLDRLSGSQGPAQAVHPRLNGECPPLRRPQRGFDECPYTGHQLWRGRAFTEYEQ